MSKTYSANEIKKMLQDAFMSGYESPLEMKEQEVAEIMKQFVGSGKNAPPEQENKNIDPNKLFDIDELRKMLQEARDVSMKK